MNNAYRRYSHDVVDNALVIFCNIVVLIMSIVAFGMSVEFIAIHLPEELWNDSNKNIPTVPLISMIGVAHAAMALCQRLSGRYSVWYNFCVTWIDGCVQRRKQPDASTSQSDRSGDEMHSYIRSVVDISSVFWLFVGYLVPPW